MRKITALIGLVFASALFLISCQEDVEVWDSETLEYSGRYVVKLMDESMTTTYHDYDKSELSIYNTSANVPNEMWIDNTIPGMFYLKSKFFFTGNPVSFRSANTEFDKLTDNLPSVEAPANEPTAEGQTIEEKRDYLRAFVEDGKIIPKAVTTKGGNIADSLYLKLKLYSGTATFKSQPKPENEWKNPTIPEYSWKLSSLTHDASKDEVIIIGGYAYTGFPEDKY
ncbi:lipid-binding protein [Bacteroides timonensis]|uniref:lipid-binding protein n=1 Tax=Bacteroides timonensis TaxID=1470345 RepID=UPI0004B48E77|nr:lipid-binding protein [Bacteroides timonensis]